MPRGGRRPGAGAPRGNFNAYKTGKYSPRARKILDALVADPEARRAILALAMAPTPRKPRPGSPQSRLDRALAAGGKPPPLFTVEERCERLTRTMRRMRATLLARARREEARANSWRALLAEEEARLAESPSSPSPSTGRGPVEDSPRRGGGVHRTPIPPNISLRLRQRKLSPAATRSRFRTIKP